MHTISHGSSSKRAGAYMTKAARSSGLTIAFAGFALCGAQSQAQDRATQEVEEVVVTGSRIARSNETTSTPLQVLSTQALEDEGTFDIGESLRDIPASAAGTQSLETSSTGSYTAGITSANLRGLNDTRTLVLINGRRHVSGVQSESVVDLSVIPPELVERMEVITGGASAVYGSDAVGGVVNVILKRRFEGLKLNTQFGQSTHGDGENHKVSILAGTASEDDRRGAIGYIGYSNSERIHAGDRDFARDAILVNNLARPDQWIVGDAALIGRTAGRTTIFYPTATTASLTATRSVVLPDGQTIAPYDPARDGLSEQPYRLLKMPARRYQIAGLGDFQFNDRVRFFFETNFVRSETFADIQPTFVISGSTSNLGGGRPTASPVTIPVDNPFIPAALRAQIPAGRTEFAFGRYIHEFGARSYEFTRNTFRGVVGFDGNFDLPFADQAWSWEVSYNYGRTSIHNQQQLANILNLYEGLRVEPDGSGGYRCTDLPARARGCIPINLFTGRDFTAAELAWLSNESHVNSDVDQQVASAQVSGSLFALPAGSLGVAAGVEWREESSDHVPDLGYVQGLVSGAVQLPVAGEFSVREAFIEFNAPLLHGLPMIARLELEAAFRAADYSSSGRADAWKFGGSWSPIDDLRFRAVKARAVRAPNIGELFGPPTYGGASVLDPCNGGGLVTGLNPTTAATRRAYCASIGIPSTYTQPTPVVATYTGGNDELDTEKADTLTVGIVYRPRFLPDATLALDYYDIKIEDAIATIGTGQMLNQCADSGGAAFFCSNVFRDPVTLGVTRVDNQQLNVATLETRGVDMEMRYSYAIAPLDARLTLDLNWTHLMEYESQQLASAPVVRLDSLSTYPEDKAALRIGLDRGPWRLAITERYISPTKRIVDLSFPGNEISAYFYTDMQLRYSHDDAWSAYVGASNVFDKAPPVIPVGYPGNIFGYMTDPRTYDALGRMVYVGLSANF